MVERWVHYTWERPCMRDYWVVIVQNFSLIHSISDQLCHAVGPLVLPAASSPRQPVHEETNVLLLRFCSVITQNTISYGHENFLRYMEGVSIRHIFYLQNSSFIETDDCSARTPTRLKEVRFARIQTYISAVQLPCKVNWSKPQMLSKKCLHRLTCNKNSFTWSCKSHAKQWVSASRILYFVVLYRFNVTHHKLRMCCYHGERGPVTREVDVWELSSRSSYKSSLTCSLNRVLFGKKVWRCSLCLSPFRRACRLSVLYTGKKHFTHIVE